MPQSPYRSMLTGLLAAVVFYGALGADVQCTTVEATRSGPVFLELLAPTGGEVIEQESTFEIRWSSGGFAGNVLIEYSSTGPGGSFMPIAPDEPNDGSFDWFVDPAIFDVSLDGSIRVSSLEAHLSDVSGSFWLYPPSHPQFLELLAPTGGEVIGQESTFEIRWISDGFHGNVVIEYSSTGPGGSFMPIALDEANDGSFDWYVDPGIFEVSSDYAIRMSSRDEPTNTDISGPFAVVQPTGIFYVNDGETQGDVFSHRPGDDFFDGLSPDTPKASIQSVLDAYDLGPQDEIRVDTGSYPVTSNITIAGEDSGVRILGPRQLGGAAVLDRGDPTSGSFAFQIDGAQGVELRDLEIVGAGIGIRAGTGTAGLVVAGNLVHSNATGIQIDTGGGAVAVRNNLVYDNTNLALQVEHGDGDIVNNTIYQLEGTAVEVSGSSLTTLANNIVRVDAGLLLDVASDAQAGFDSDWNLFDPTSGAVDIGSWGDTLAPTLLDWQNQSGQDANTLVADPLFRDVDGGDGRFENFALVRLSPAIDAGDGDLAPSADIDGQARRDDPGTPNTGVGAISFAEIGAYEFLGHSADATPPAVEFLVNIPANGGLTLEEIPRIEIEFGESLDANSARRAGSYRLVEAGPDGQLDTGDDIAIGVVPSYEQAETRVVLDLPAGPLGNGSYRLTLFGSSTIFDTAGNRLDGDGDGVGGDDFVVAFQVDTNVLPGDANLDGSVDGADYTIWADGYGSMGASFVGGDFNGDGLVDDADYTIWADHFGETTGGGA